MTSMSIRLPDNLGAQLADLAEATGRTKSYLAIQALKDFVSQQSWQIAEIKKGLAEAEAGDFASDEEMEDLQTKWNQNAD